MIIMAACCEHLSLLSYNPVEFISIPHIARRTPPICTAEGIVQRPQDIRTAELGPSQRVASQDMPSTYPSLNSIRMTLS